jgi:hypothetical protein
MVTDRKLRITWVNAVYTHTGYIAEEAIGKTPYELLTQSNGPSAPAAQAIIDAQQQGKPISHRDSNVKKMVRHFGAIPISSPFDIRPR